MAVLTVSRQLGSNGREIAVETARRLGAAYFDREILSAAAEQMGVPEEQLAELDERSVGFVERLANAVVGAFSLRETHIGRGVSGSLQGHAREVSDVRLLRATKTVIRRLANEGSVVIVGRAGQAVVGNLPHAVHVRIMAAPACRATRLSQARGISYQAAMEVVAEADLQGQSYWRRFYHVDWNDPCLYDLILNTERMAREDAVSLLVTACVAVDKREVRSALALVEPYSDRGAVRAAQANLRQALGFEVGSAAWKEAIRTSLHLLRSDAACTNAGGGTRVADCCAAVTKATSRLALLHREPVRNAIKGSPVA